MQRLRSLYDRYFENRYSGKDWRELKGIFEAGLSDLQSVDEMQKQWMDFCAGETDEKDMKAVLARIHSELFIEESRKKRQPRIFRYLQRIAAVLFIIFLIGGVFFFHYGGYGERQVSWVEIQCPDGVRTGFELPDGSGGYLYSGSVLRYRMPFAGKREVHLSGEAFFDVVHKKRSQFQVITKNLAVKVTGTRFNIQAFEDMNFEEVTLEEGRVDIYDKNRRFLSSLEPDLQMRYDLQNGKFVLKPVDASQYVLWTKGKLIFQDEKFEQIVKRLSLWYNVNIVIADKRLNDYVFHATFENEQLEEALHLIELTTPVTYRFEKRKVNPDGSLGVKTVVLSFSEEKEKEFK